MRHLFAAALLCAAFCAGLTYAGGMFGFQADGLAATSFDNTKIIGGEPVANGKRPWIAWIESRDSEDDLLMECGGVILTTTMVMTSAQCIRNAASIHVTVGDVDKTSVKGAARTIDASKWIMHPDFYINILHNDIALVNLSVSLAFNDYIQPLKMPKKSLIKTVDTFTGKIVTAHGWGGGGEDPNCPSIDRFRANTPLARAGGPPVDFVDMKVMNTTDCALLLREIYYDLPKTISCADTMRGQVGVCNTDVGGPVTYIYPSDTFPTLVGIISDWEDCPTNYPNTFTFIGAYLDWIAANGGPKVVP